MAWAAGRVMTPTYVVASKRKSELSRSEKGLAGACWWPLARDARITPSSGAGDGLLSGTTNLDGRPVSTAEANSTDRMHELRPSGR
jgi:hypothetical protein